VVGLATVLGAGGGTSSYREVEEADVVILWGSNARETHPIFFHHVLTALHKGAQLFVVDPRRTSSARFADRWLGLTVGSDIALAHAMGREIIHAGLAHTEFINNATTGYDDYAASVEPWTLERAAAVTGVPEDAIKAMAHAYARAGKAQLCWTLGITEHHNAVDNVVSLINLALLTGHVGRDGSGLSPLRGQNNVQGGGDMGALPNKLPGFQDVQDASARMKFESAWGVSIPANNGWNLTEMFEGMERGELRAAYVVGENPAQSEADSAKAIHLLESLDHLVVQDIFRTKTAELADVVFPASAAWCETDGTVTNSERRVQRVRKAINAPAGVRDDVAIIGDLARAMGHEWLEQSAEQVWDELRSLSPLHKGMNYARLEALGGIQWPCPSEETLEPSFLHGRLWAEKREDRGRLAPFSSVEWAGPVDELTEEFPLRLTTGRRLDSYNSGVQSGGFKSPLRMGETIDMNPSDASALGLADGEDAVVSSRRGSLIAPVRFDDSLRPGLAFMTMHFPDEIDVNILTIDYTDPRSGTAEFKASAIRVEKFTHGGSAPLNPRSQEIVPTATTTRMPELIAGQ
jgi:predicted molibdopterin-dependent oxidoreductase YjgC